MIHLVRGIEFLNALLKTREIGMLSVTECTALQSVFRAHPRLPNDLDQDVAGLAFLVKQHFPHDKAQDLLSVACRCCFGLPYTRQVYTQVKESSVISVTQSLRRATTPLLVFLFDHLDGAQLVFPNPLKGASYQTIFGLYCIILTACSFGIV